MKRYGNALLLTCTSLILACGDRGESRDGPSVEVRVAPLQLPGIGFACFDLRVQNATATVWSRGNPALTRLGADQTGGVTTGAPDTRTVCSDDYGSGAGGDIVYVGPCDATSDSDGDATNGVQNRVTLWVDGLYDAAGTSDVGGWSDPCPNGCSLQVDCDPNRDSPAEFDLTVMRSAGQGFFDIGVDFDDIFCAAKLDTCYAGDEHIKLLFGADSTRDWTAVFGFACTAGPGADLETELLYSAVAVTCGGVTFPIDLRAAPGNNHVTVGGRRLHYGIYRGDESLHCNGAPCNKRYWNFAVSLDDLQGFGLGGCQLTLSATATGASEFSAGLPTGTGLAWPYVTAAASLTNTSGAASCQRHPLAPTGSAVTTTYAGDLEGLPDPVVMCSRFAGATPEPTGGVGCPVVPDPVACPDGLETITTDVVIDATTALAELACVGAIAGNLTITGVSATTIALPNLTDLGGTLTIVGNPGLTSIGLPNLTSAAGIVVDDNPSLTSLDLSGLTTTDTFVVTDNPSLSTCEVDGLLAQLTPAPTTVNVSGNGLETIDGDLVVDLATPPANLQCIGAVSGNLTITGVGATTLGLPNLTDVGGTLIIAGTDLTALSLPGLTTAGGIDIDGNDALTDLSLPALDTTGSFTVTDNPSLSTCDVQAILGQLTPAPTTTTIAGNGLDTYVGDLLVDVASPLSPADLLCIGAVTGSLTITGVGWTTLDLPNLGNVGGTLTIAGNANATAINLPALT
ncbi:MAG: hypothetical protein IT385_06695, partial [Deltaproteobacteria bacterium]|nr:hypothetical protein [Deltaproteobacteria bacterium]